MGKTLSDAIVLRLGLGDETQAVADAEQYLRAYASRDDAPMIAAAIVLHFADDENWTAVLREAPRKMTMIDRGAIAVRMQTHAAFARALAATHDARASREYARVRDMARELHEPHDGDGGALRKFAKGLDAYGEALVVAADEKRDATAWTPLAANATATAIDAWTAARVASIRAASAEYEKVVAIQPEPPPRWVIAAAARSAAMWTRAADELVARLPAKKRSEQIPLRDTDAKRAAKACVDYSAKYQYTDDGSRACVAWLEKTYRREYPPLDELAIAHAPCAFNAATQRALP